MSNVVIYIYVFIEGALIQIVKLQKAREVLSTSAHVVGCIHENVLTCKVRIEIFPICVSFQPVIAMNELP